MATYLQGVTDFIPQYQPFTPDLNFYDTVLKTKQNQYDSNWKQLNKVYGQYFYADLTRDDNIKKKEELVKNIGFNLQRVAGLDLSLQQNVDQAVQVFTPFYQDKSLMKDMAYTKNWNNQYNAAKNLKNSGSEEERKLWWNTGIREMEYLRDEFKNASAEQAMTFRSPDYTSYVNASAEARKIAKAAGIEAQTVKFSKDGRFIITTKNGQQIKEPLQKLFENELGKDPRIQAVYKTQSYVNRKDYAFGNAAQFGGDKNAAEMKYLENNYKILQNQNKKYYLGLKDRDQKYNDKIAALEEKMKSKKGSPQELMMLDDLKMNRDINSQSLQRIEKEYEQFKNGSSTATTSSGFENPYGDVDALRRKVDGGVAQMLMRKDLDEAAQIQSMRGYSQTIKTNPYALQAEKFRNALALQSRKFSNQRAMYKQKRKDQDIRDQIKYNKEARKEAIANKKLENKALLDSGLYENDIVEKKFRVVNGVKVFEDDPRLVTMAQQATEEKRKTDPNAIVTPQDVYNDLPAATEQIEMVVNKDEFGMPALREKEETKGASSEITSMDGTTDDNIDAVEVEQATKAVRAQQARDINSVIQSKKQTTMDFLNFIKTESPQDYKDLTAGLNFDTSFKELEQGKKLETNTTDILDLYKRIDNYAKENKDVKNNIGGYINNADLSNMINLKERADISANLDNLQAIADWKTSTSGTKVDFMKEMQAKGIPLTHLSMQALAMGKNGEALFNKTLAPPDFAKLENLGKPQGKAPFQGAFEGFVDFINRGAEAVYGEPLLSSRDGISGKIGDMVNIPKEDAFSYVAREWKAFNEKRSKGVPPIIMENLGVTSKGTGVHSDFTKAIDVGTGLGYGAEVTRQVQKDISQSVAPLSYSYLGLGNPDEFDSDMAEKQEAFNKIAPGVLNAYLAQQRTDNLSHMIKYSGVSHGTIGKEATILMLDPKWIDDNTGKTEDETKLFTPEVAAGLKTNGFSITGAKGTFEHALAVGTREDAIDIAIRNAGPEGKTFELAGDASYNVKYDKLTKSYTTELSYLSLHEEGYSVISKPGTYDAGDWDQAYNEMDQYMKKQEEENTEAFNYLFPNKDKATWNDQQIKTWEDMRETIITNRYSNQGPVRWADRIDVVSGKADPKDRLTDRESLLIGEELRSKGIGGTERNPSEQALYNLKTGPYSRMTPDVESLSLAEGLYAGELSKYL